MDETDTFCLTCSEEANYLDVHQAHSSRFIERKSFPIAHNHCPLNDILQLANVAWPVISFKLGQGFFLYGLDLFPSFLGVTVDQVSDKQRNIANALARYRYSNREDIKTVE